MSNEQKYRKVLEAIVRNYLETEKSLISQLNFDLPNHGLTLGSFREEIWKQLFEQLVPKKYVIEQSVFLIDSKGSVSKEVDLVIFDEMYTPYIFRNGRIKFIPIEAVAAVVQSKSGNVEGLEEWCASIDQLQTATNAIARMATFVATSLEPTSTQSATRPIKVLCQIGTAPENGNKVNVPIAGFDFEFIADKNNNKISILYPQEKILFDWFNDLNNHQPGSQVARRSVAEEQGYPSKLDKFAKSEQGNLVLNDYRVIAENGQAEVSLLSFNFQFNQLLMLINNPMLFPHKAYVELFKRIYSEMHQDESSSKKAEKR
ncbi:hypothetical protein GCM10011391_12610 [Pullulanibacillus camelliae]|uniref:DUF6602 domain-containing protein n=1 Tax=Pullulanibacillus camelliae TaxID=1707096 RepID=A0A8J2VQ37_9BACL|nr:DUF6602 domain-containing protein [Pullulanibacillus camelliae]GGE35359.1 hypothetical protein GCM10011391_12610 [Pullulanibacillus camelliae]